jgi:hypothetical protein
MKVLLVVIAITPGYLENYTNKFRKSHEQYAKKHNYDFRVIDYMLDTTINHTSAFSFQKILVCSQYWSEQYDYIVCIDADIFINPESPAIHDYVKDEKIGIVDEMAQPSVELREEYDGTAKDYYKQVPSIELDTRMILNTGVMVFQPKLHCKFLRSIFDKHVIGCMTSNRGYHYEQTTVGYELQTHKMFTLIPNKFNALWGLSKHMKSTSHITLEEFYKDNYFIHFAGCVDWFLVPVTLHKYLE